MKSPPDHVDVQVEKVAKDRLVPWFCDIYHLAIQIARKIFRIFVNTSINYSEKRGQEAAASLAFYSIFSLFPMLIILVSIVSFVIQEDLIKAAILNSIYNFIPISRDLIRINIERALGLRSAIGFFGLVTLSWTATNYFHILIKNLNLVWPEAIRRGFIRTRLYAFVFVGICGLLIVLSLLISTVFKFLSHFQIPIRGSIALYGTFIWSLITKIVPFFARFIVIWILYIWGTTSRAKRSAGFWGALFATICWETFTFFFSLVLQLGLSKYEIIYGSLAALLTLYLWIYMINFFVLYGAHLSAAISLEISSDQG
jgi:membrane protein